MDAVNDESEKPETAPVEETSSNRPGRTGAALVSEARSMAMLLPRTERVDTLRATGMIVLVEPQEFVAVVAKMNKPMVILAEGALSMTFRYVTVYKDMIFFSKSEAPVSFANEVELIRARKIWLPERGV